MKREEISAPEARRVVLAAQGFDQPRPTRVDARHLRRTLRRLGLLQIDYVNVLVPAHYQVLFSRLGPYERGRLDELVYRRREFTEQWAHEASIVPIETWPLLGYRRDAHRVRPWGFEKHLKKDPDYASRALAEISERGALSADELPEIDGAPQRTGTAWGWGRSVRRQVLESHFGAGRLAVTARLPNFARSYDLAERIVPAEHLKLRVERADAQRELLRQAARASGVATASDLADYFRMSARDARPLVEELAEEGELVPVRVEGWREQAYMDRGARLPRRADATALVSPFDPLVWFRPRVARLFAFDYRLEIFVPAPKRKWGYYVLPFLLGDRLVARVDLKAERSEKRLAVRAAHPEPGIDRDVVGRALAAELLLWARWLDLERVSVGPRGGLARVLAAAVRAAES